MAEGRTNGLIAEALVVTEGAVEKHVTNIFHKLGLPPADQAHRRVLAVLRYLSTTTDDRALADRRLALAFGGVARAAVLRDRSAVQVAGWTIGSVERDVARGDPRAASTSCVVDAAHAATSRSCRSSDEVVIDSRASGTLHTPELQVRPRRRARARQRRLPGHHLRPLPAREIIVHVPRGTAVEVESGSGDMTASGLTGASTSRRPPATSPRHEPAAATSDLRQRARATSSARGLRGDDAAAHAASGDVTAGSLARHAT